jgi:hypothetical protein
MENEVVKFSREAMHLFLKQHFLLKDKIFAVEDEKIRAIQDELISVTRKIHLLLDQENPHVRVVVGLGGNFKAGKESYLMKYTIYQKRKKIFEYPNNLVCILPPDFSDFSDFCRFANRNDN